MKLDSLYIYQGDIVLSEEQAMNVATKSGAWSNQTKYILLDLEFCNYFIYLYYE